MPKENKRNTEEILFSYLEGTASVEEREWVENWLKEDSSNQKHFDEIKVLRHWFKNGQKPAPLNREESWARIKAEYYKSGFMNPQQAEKSRSRKILYRFAIPAAAAVVFAFLAGFYIRALLHKDGYLNSKQIYNEVYVPLGSRSQVTLSDGTRVWLNAGSRLRYPVEFLKSNREVMLEGEAYFDVTKNLDKIFIVKTSDIYVKVYGTQFNIKCYPEENIIQTTLVKGSLSVEPVKGNNKNNTVYLKPNQTVEYYKKGKGFEGPQRNITSSQETIAARAKPDRIILTPVVDPVPITSWKDSKWVIAGESLEELAVKLDRRYNVKITITDESLKNYKFSGTLKDETFEQILKILQISMPIIYTVNGNNVILSEDKSFKPKYDTMIKNPERQKAN
jgi:ferric-dicitrate binding protein FerR (iron transport regulator)